MLQRYNTLFMFFRRQSQWRWITFLCLAVQTLLCLCTFIVLKTTPLMAEEQTLSGNLYQFLEDDMDFSKSELKNMRAGKVVTKQLDTKVKQEVPLVSIVKINVPKDFFIQHYEQEGMNIEMAKVEAGGMFGNPPEIADVEGLTMPSTDIGELKKCKIGDCKIKAPAEAIEVFRQLDESASDFKAQADALFRQEVVKYVQDYLKGGNAAMIEYQDKKNSIQIAEEFQDVLKRSPYLDVYMPELRKYLEDFPNSGLPNAKSDFYWMVENFGGKAKRPTLSVHHIVFYQPEAGGEMIVASKQLYANHYYEAALGLTVIVDDPENSELGFYLMHINRSRIDVLREVPGFLASDLFKGARTLLDEKMQLVKKNAEALYQAK